MCMCNRLRRSVITPETRQSVCTCRPTSSLFMIDGSRSRDRRGCHSLLIIMAALWNRTGHYIFYIVVSSSSYSPCNSPCVASPVGNSYQGGLGLSGLVHEEAVYINLYSHYNAGRDRYRNTDIYTQEKKQELIRR